MSTLVREVISPEEPSIIFISHSSTDEAIVRWLTEQVSATGNLAWVAEWDLHPGQNISTKVLDALRECDAYIILLTRAGYDSRYVTHETGAAAASGKPVIALVDITLADEPMGLLSEIEQVRFDRNDLAASTAAITTGLIRLATKRGLEIDSVAVAVPTQPTIFSMSLDMSLKFQVTPNQVLVGVSALMLIGGLIYLASLEDRS